MVRWTRPKIDTAINILSRHRLGEIATACQEIAACLCEPVTRDGLERAFRRFDLGAPGNYCKGASTKVAAGDDEDPPTLRSGRVIAPPGASERPLAPRDDRVRRLVELTQKRPRS